MDEEEDEPKTLETVKHVLETCCDVVSFKYNGLWYLIEL